MEVVKLQVERMLGGYSTVISGNADLFGLHNPIQELESLQMLPRTESHSMEIHCRHLINDALRGSLAVILPCKGIRNDNLVRELPQGFLESFMALGSLNSALGRD